MGWSDEMPLPRGYYRVVVEPQTWEELFANYLLYFFCLCVFLGCLYLLRGRIEQVVGGVWRSVQMLLAYLSPILPYLVIIRSWLAAKAESFAVRATTKPAMREALKRSLANLEAAISAKRGDVEAIREGIDKQFATHRRVSFELRHSNCKGRVWQAQTELLHGFYEELPSFTPEEEDPAPPNKAELPGFPPETEIAGAEPPCLTMRFLRGIDPDCFQMQQREAALKEDLRKITNLERDVTAVRDQQDKELRRAQAALEQSEKKVGQYKTFELTWRARGLSPTLYQAVFGRQDFDKAFKHLAFDIKPCTPFEENAWKFVLLQSGVSSPAPDRSRLDEQDAMITALKDEVQPLTAKNEALTADKKDLQGRYDRTLNESNEYRERVFKCRQTHDPALSEFEECKTKIAALEAEKLDLFGKVAQLSELSPRWTSPS